MTWWSSNLFGRRIGALLVPVVVASLVSTGCDDSPSVEPDDVDAFHELYGNAVDSDEPYLRAEALRMMEVFERRDLDAKPASIVKSERADPMVRIAALRALLATDHRDGEGFALNRFTSGDNREKRGVLEAVLDLGSTKFSRRLVWRSLEGSQPSSLRRFAIREALVPRVRRAIKNDNRDVVKRQLRANVTSYIRGLDREIGGLLLRLLLRLDTAADLVDGVLETLRDRTAKTSRRVAAAELLAEARAERARSTFERILDLARTQSAGSGLKVPDEGVDRRLVKWSVFGLAALGREEMVPEAKEYFQNAEADTVIRVLEAIQPNPANGARLAFETRLEDPTPRIRHRAVQLYAERDDAKVAQLVESVVDNVDMISDRVDDTRRIVAAALLEHFSDEWVGQVRDNLQSAAGSQPALEFLVAVQAESGGDWTAAPLRERLVDLAGSEADRTAALAAYLLAYLRPEARSEEVVEAIRGVSHPMARYAHLDSLVREAPKQHVGYLLEHFYPSHDTTESAAIRLVSGLGLWLAAGAPSPDDAGGADAS